MRRIGCNGYEELAFQICRSRCIYGERCSDLKPGFTNGTPRVAGGFCSAWEDSGFGAQNERAPFQLFP